MISLTALSLAAMLAQAAPCESLRTLTLPNTTITSAQLVPAGAFTPPPPQGPPGGPVAPAAQPAGDAGRGAGGRGGAGAGRGGAPATPPTILPAHCRVAATLKPSSDSHIDMEV